MGKIYITVGYDLHCLTAQNAALYNVSRQSYTYCIICDIDRCVRCDAWIPGCDEFQYFPKSHFGQRNRVPKTMADSNK